MILKNQFDIPLKSQVLGSTFKTERNRGKKIYKYNFKK